MLKETEERLARSLTADTTDALPYLPYLLQDLWELGSCPRDMINLIRKHMPLSKDTRILDLGCGKGAVLVRIAESLGISVVGYDIMPDFIEYAKQKASEFGVSSLCHFTVGDANEIVETEKGYDCVILGATGDILGRPPETLKKLKKTIKPEGFILLDEAFLPDGLNSDKAILSNYEYLKHEQWLRLFDENGLSLLGEVFSDEEYIDSFDSETETIALRASELIARYPEKRTILEGYVQSQSNECKDLENTIVGVTWMLRSSG